MVDPPWVGVGARVRVVVTPLTQVGAVLRSLTQVVVGPVLLQPLELMAASPEVVVWVVVWALERDSCRLTPQGVIWIPDLEL